MARTILLAAAFITIVSMGATRALAQPSLPATFYGSVTINGEPAPTGTEVRGFVDGVDCTQSAPGERPAIQDGGATAYVIAVVHETQRPGCARAGSTVVFTVNGEKAPQRALWQPGPTQVDLSIGDGDIVPLPTSTATSPAAAATTPPSPSSEPSPIPGTPPTDDVTLPGTSAPSPAATVTEGVVSGAGLDEPPPEGESSAALPLIVTLVAVLAVGGAAAGFALSRRGNAGDV